MADIFTPDPKVLADAGIHGATGPLIDNGQGQLVGEAVSAQSADINTPQPMPELKAIAGQEKETFIKKALKALHNGAKEGKFKLAPAEQKELKTLRKSEGRTKDWPSKVAGFLAKVDRDGSLKKKFKASGLSSKDPKAEAYALKIAKEGDAPKPAGKISAARLKQIQAQSRTPVSISTTSMAATDLRKSEGYDDVMAREEPHIMHPSDCGRGELKKLAAFTFYKTGGRVTLSNATAQGVPVPQLVQALKMRQATTP